MTSLRDRITLIPRSADWLNEQAVKYHYMARPIIPLACPFGWGVRFDGSDYLPSNTNPDGTPANGGSGIPTMQPCGFIVFSTLQYTRLKGEFGYPGLPTQWQVLHLARLWLHDDLPYNSETCVMAKAHHLVQQRWLEVHPPRFPDQPYHIRKIISYADLRYHVGTVYRAANYRCLGDRVVRAGAYAKAARWDYNQLSMFEAETGGAPDGVAADEDRMLRCFVFDLPEPDWKWQPESRQLEMFGEGQP